MKRKYQKPKNGKLRRPAKKTIELFQPKIEDNLSTMKKSKNKDEVCESSKTPQRNLRTRTVKNYSERFKIIKCKPAEKVVTKKSPEIVSGNRIPIYKTIKLEEEKEQSLDGIYDFIDDLPESDQKVKKRKKSARKPSVKRAKKLPGFQYNVFQKSKLKAAKSVSKNVQLKEQKKQSITKPEQTVKHNIYADIKIPEHLQNAGDSTIAEASTIIMQDQRFEQSDSSSLNKCDTLQLDIQESNLSNHSLITQSISPITKEVNNLFIGSPWESSESFFQVQNVVQSTPQRVLTGQEKKEPVKMNLNQKLICSEDAIQLSSRPNEKLFQQNVDGISQIQKKSISPRKFGTVISNVHSVSTNPVSSVLLHQKQQSPLTAEMSSTSFDNKEIVQEMQANRLPISSKKASKIKILKIDQVLSPLKFKDILQSCKLIVHNEFSKSNVENSNFQKENTIPDLVAGPSNSEKSKAVILRQSNLNNFLNLDEMPESTCISTAHGIFSDVNNSTVNGKKPLFDESNIENQLGTNNSVYRERSSPIKKSSVSIIATARDVARSVKGKLFVKARVKSSLTRRVPENMMKKTLLKNVQESASELKALVNEKTVQERNIEDEKSKSNFINNENKNNKIIMDVESERNKTVMEVENEKSLNLMQDEIENIISLIENEKSTSLMQDENENNIGLMENENEKNTIFMEYEDENNASLKENENEMSTIHMEDANENIISHKDSENISILLDPKKAFLDSISFSDTFDFLSENGEDASSKIPDDIPIFVDLEPVHFSQPPRRSYTKTKKAICFNTSRCDSEGEHSEEDEYNKPKKKRKKASRQSKEEQKRMQQWIKSVNESFKEIDEFNLTVE